MLKSSPRRNARPTASRADRAALPRALPRDRPESPARESASVFERAVAVSRAARAFGARRERRRRGWLRIETVAGGATTRARDKRRRAPPWRRRRKKTTARRRRASSRRCNRRERERRGTRRRGSRRRCWTSKANGVRARRDAPGIARCARIGCLMRRITTCERFTRCKARRIRRW